MNDFAHLHVQSSYSLRRGASSPSALVARALELGHTSLAITDHLSIAGHVPAQIAARAAGINLILGAEVPLLTSLGVGFEAVGHIVLLCQSRVGYAQLNRLITTALERPVRGVTLADLLGNSSELIALTGGRDGALRVLLGAGRQHAALELLGELRAVFGQQRLFVELAHHQREGDIRANRALARLAISSGVRCALTNDVRHADPDGFALCDAITLSRLGMTIEDDALERPWNDAGHLAGRAELEMRLNYPAAYEVTLGIADACRVNLLAPKFSAPVALIPEGDTPASRLEALVRAGIVWRYPLARREQALALMTRELAVIAALALEHYFLAVHEVTQAARALGIRTSGRGSAAASIVVYTLGIAHADPLRFRLSFERFLNAERMSLEPPDIDIDVQSSKRAELIAWVVQRFGHEFTAMAANHNTYGLRGALRDAGKVLGFPLPTVDRLCKAVSGMTRPRHVSHYRASLEAVIGSSPLLDVLIALVERFDGLPRDLSLHSGGMLLSPLPLDAYSPRFTSSGGTWQSMLNKDSAEAIGLIKLDLLGLRILDVVQMSVELLEQMGIDPDLEQLSFNDELVFETICDGEILALFQIESPGQANLGARLQPRDFTTLVAQIALNRPGAIQAGSVHPYVRRYAGLERATVLHHSLELPLRETLGVIVYQDQVVDIGIHTCGWTGGVADGFRKALSKVREPGDLEPLEARFIAAAMNTHADLSVADSKKLFQLVAAYRGYGFPRAHSVAFGVIAYQTAFLKTFFAAAYLCAVLEHAPGMYNAQTVRGEAERLGVRVLAVSLEDSQVRFALERSGEDQRLAIRVPFSAVTGLSNEHASAICNQRERSAFASIEDLYRRVALPRDVLEGLARAGAFDAFSTRRDALWTLGVLETRLGSSGAGNAPLLDVHAFTEGDLVALEGLGVLETIAWDVRVASSSATHPVAPLRLELERLGAVPIASLANARGAVVIAGLRGMIQRPQTAHGTRFILVEDETGLLQCIVARDAWPRLERAFAGGLVIVRGAVQRVGQWRALSVQTAASLDQTLEFAGVAKPRVMHLQ